MEVIRKVYFVLIFVALISFVGGVAVAEDNAKININTATVEELTALKGVGEKKAHSIVEHRKEAGLFVKIEDLKNVKGVGDKIFNKIKDLIVVE
ncbi:MAG: ComEA family DNA-binding protein [Maribacter sp.]|nr:ComEA family DNA-binding protein [Maribacter sp.]